MDYQKYFQQQSISHFSTVMTGLIGFCAGVATWLMALGLNTFLLIPLFCGEGNLVCQSTPTVALVTALGIAHFMALVALVRIGVIRPLLIVLVSLLTLWGFQMWIQGDSWWLASLFVGALFALSYAFYAWVNRVINFPIAFGITVIAVIVSRLLITSW